MEIETKISLPELDMIDWELLDIFSKHYPDILYPSEISKNLNYSIKTICKHCHKLVSLGILIKLGSNPAFFLLKEEKKFIVEHGMKVMNAIGVKNVPMVKENNL